MNINYFISFNMFIISMMLFSFNFKHLMMTLISLEFIMISVFYNLYMILWMIQSQMYLMILFLTMSVCEGALALSLLVLMVRMHGNDYVNSLSLVKW